LQVYVALKHRRKVIYCYTDAAIIKTQGQLIFLASLNATMAFCQRETRRNPEDDPEKWDRQFKDWYVNGPGGKYVPGFSIPCGFCGGLFALTSMQNHQLNVCAAKRAAWLDYKDDEDKKKVEGSKRVSVLADRNKSNKKVPAEYGHSATTRQNINTSAGKKEAESKAVGIMAKTKDSDKEGGGPVSKKAKCSAPVATALNAADEEEREKEGKTTAAEKVNCEYAGDLSGTFR
jgi:hypothetical protein